MTAASGWASSCRRIYLSVGKTAISRGRAEVLPVFTTHNHNRVLVVNSVVRLSHNSQPQQAPLKGCACSCGCRCECDNPRATPIPPPRRHGVPDSPVDGGCFLATAKYILSPQDARRAGARPARMPTGRARMCVRRRPWSADWCQARQNRLSTPSHGLSQDRLAPGARCVPAAFSRGMALCSRGRPLAPARRAESGTNLVTTL